MKYDVTEIFIVMVIVALSTIFIAACVGLGWKLAEMIL
jgi:hypothetical protein